MLDSDLAELYRVTTGNLNLAVRRNPKRFPEDFMFQLSREETQSLLLQNARAKGRPQSVDKAAVRLNGRECARIFWRSGSQDSDESSVMWSARAMNGIFRSSQTTLRRERAPKLSCLAFGLELDAERQGFKRLDHVSYAR